MHSQVFGDDDQGGGWRNREPGDLDDLMTETRNGRTAVARLVLFADQQP